MLEVAEGLALPPQVVTSAQGILAMRGAGKSNAGVDIEVTGGTFNTYLGTLRRNGLAEVAGHEVRAGEALFLTEEA